MLEVRRRKRRLSRSPTEVPHMRDRLRIRVQGVVQGAGFRVDDPLASAGARLPEGKTVAVKGLGGYHLACDALRD
jgi:hydrogenase maturation protein HypF